MANNIVLKTYRGGSVTPLDDAKRRKYIVLLPKALSAKADIEGYIGNLSRCLVREIPECSLTGIEDALRSILDSIQREM